MEIIILSIVTIFYIISWYLVFEKSGRKGWLALIPIVNILIYLKISNKLLWWIILLFIPFVNIIVLFLVARSFTRKFGDNSFWSAISLMIASFIYIPALAFDKTAVYKA